MVVQEKIIWPFYDKNFVPVREWLDGIDRFGQKIVVERIKRVSRGNYGDYKSLGGGILELRFHQGYRIYFTEIGNTIVLLLCGGDKSSQEKDIAKAREYKRRLDEKGLEYCIEKYGNST